jgi:zinc transport system permease protein
MVRALIAGLIIGLVSPLIGTFLVSKRYALMADTLSHVCLAGVAIGLLTKIYPLYSAIIVAVLAAIVIQKLAKDKKITSDATLSLFLSGGLALATVIISIARGFNADLFSYLFGSITTVSQADVWTTAILGLVISLLTVFLYKEFMYTSFDEESAKVSGVPSNFVTYTFIILTAVTIAISVRIVGVLLVSALMVIPVLCASQIARSFKQTVFYAVLFSSFFVLTGLILSFYLNLAAGGTIVLFAIICFVFVKILNSK